MGDFVEIAAADDLRAHWRWGECSGNLPCLV